MDFFIELNVECEGRYVKGYPNYFDQGFGNWLPGEPEKIEDFAVYLINKGTKVEITDALSEDEYNDLYEKYLESFKE